METDSRNPEVASQVSVEVIIPVIVHSLFVHLPLCVIWQGSARMS